MKIYLSHSIRGPKGNDATHADMKENCNKAVAVGERIREAVSSIELYIPAEHEDFVGLTYYHKYLTEKQILEIDCLIIDDCDAVIFLCPPNDFKLQGGRLVEYRHAIKINKPAYIFSDPEDAIGWITQTIIRN